MRKTSRMTWWCWVNGDSLWTSSRYMIYQYLSSILSKEQHLAFRSFLAVLKQIPRKMNIFSQRWVCFLCSFDIPSACLKIIQILEETGLLQSLFFSMKDNQASMVLWCFNMFLLSMALSRSLVQNFRSYKNLRCFSQVHLLTRGFDRMNSSMPCSKRVIELVGSPRNQGQLRFGCGPKQKTPFLRGVQTSSLQVA